MIIVGKNSLSLMIHVNVMLLADCYIEMFLNCPGFRYSIRGVEFYLKLHDTILFFNVLCIFSVLKKTKWDVKYMSKLSSFIIILFGRQGHVKVKGRDILC